LKNRKNLSVNTSALDRYTTTLKSYLLRSKGWKVLDQLEGGEGRKMLLLNWNN